jgi:hypothetical protein
MTPNDDGIEESTVIIDEIENNLANILTKKREDVERAFQERMLKEKEESDRKITKLEEEFADDKGLLGQFRSAVSEYDRARQVIRSEVQACLGKAVQYQKEIERLTGLTMEEINKADELSGRLGDLRRASEERAAEFRARIQRRFGLILEDGKPTMHADAPQPAPQERPADFEIPVPPPAERAASAAAAAPEPPHAEEPVTAPFRTQAPAPEVVPDLEMELRKLKRIKQLLENDGKADAGREKEQLEFDPELGRQLNPDLPPFPEEPAAAPEPAPDMKLPEINQIFEDFAKRPPEPIPLRPEPVEPPREERPAPKNGLSFQAVFEKLEQFRKTEALDEANELSYFQNSGRTILDGESILRSMGQVLDSAKKISGQMAQGGSAKDQFFLKQELVNQQEILRKVVLRGVKMCENESAVLPAFTAEAMNVSVLRGILEQLVQGNWSSGESLAAFEVELARLKESFYRLITPPAHYLRSILDELES